MSASRSVESPSAAIDNGIDVARKWPSTALADAIATERPLGVRLGTPSVEKIVGPGIGATVLLTKPTAGIAYTLSYTTATGVASTGGGKKQYPVETTDFTVVKKNGNGVAALKNVSGLDYSAQTWLVHHYPDDAEGTIGGQSHANAGIQGS